MKDKIHICDSLEKNVDDSGDELWCTNWIKETFKKKNINSNTLVILPLTAYQDRTGAIMFFSLANIIFSDKLNIQSWHHFGLYL